VRDVLCAFLSTKILDAEFCVFCVFAVINSCSSCCACLIEAKSERDDVVDSLLVKQFVTEQSTGAAAQLTTARRTIQRSQTDTADQEISKVIASVSTAALPVACNSYPAVFGGSNNDDDDDNSNNNNSNNDDVYDLEVDQRKHIIILLYLLSGCKVVTSEAVIAPVMSL